MNNELEIGIISEGLTDFTIINAIVCHKFSKTKPCKQLYPRLDVREKNGWFGVWRFCRDDIATKGFDAYCDGIFPQLNLLIVCLDGDQSRNGTHFCELFGKATEAYCGSCLRNSNAYSCANERVIQGPYEGCTYLAVHKDKKIDNIDIVNRVAFLEKCIQKWLGANSTEKRLIITIPCDAIEAWLASYFDGGIIDGIPIEAYQDIFRNYIRTREKKHYSLVLDQREPTAKQQLAELFRDNVAHWLNDITNRCTQVHKFLEALDASVFETSEDEHLTT